jgi:hypothetical protein
MMLNWGAFYVDLSQNGLAGLYASKMLAALSQVRNVFHGTIRLLDTNGGVDPSTAAFATLYGAVDVIQAEPYANPLTPDENQNLTFTTVKAVYKGVFAQWAQRYASLSKPVVLYALFQSHRNYLLTGWVEDSFCVSGTDAAGNLVPCVQQTLQTDFSVQAIAYEAVLEAAMESGINLYSFDTKGYWYVDVILPDDSFPNTGQTIRNKPAEAILQRWFAR